MDVPISIRVRKDRRDGLRRNPDQSQARGFLPERRGDEKRRSSLFARSWLGDLWARPRGSRKSLWLPDGEVASSTREISWIKIRESLSLSPRPATLASLPLAISRSWRPQSATERAGSSLTLWQRALWDVAELIPFSWFTFFFFKKNKSF